VSGPFVGEIRMFAGNFAPAGWAFCNGQLVPISENPTLFQLIGTTYGGDGTNTFALPNLQSRLPFGPGSGFVLGQAGGAEAVTLTTAQIPAHSHQFLASTGNGTLKSPVGNMAAAISGGASAAYIVSTPNVAMAPDTIGGAGGSQPHDNMQPFLVISFIISLFGVFPSPS
jgi:microcystin-dependent protein